MESVNAITNFKVDPAVDVDVVQEILFVDELLGDVGQHYADVFWPVEWGLEVKVFDVKGDKRCALPRENAVEVEFYEIKRCSLGADVARVCDVLGGDCDASAVGVGLFRSDASYNLQEGNALPAVGGNVFVA